jgi:hypothetical protein
MRQSAIALLIAIAACGGSSDTPTATKTVTGTYALATYKGSAPPVVVLDDPANSLKIEIVSGTFSITEGRTYSSVNGIRTTNRGVVTTSSYTCTGSYVFGGTTLAFTEVDNGQYCGGNFVASWDGGDALTFAFKNGDSAVFRR